MSSAAFPKGGFQVEIGAVRKVSRYAVPVLRDGTTCFAANSEQLAAVLMEEAARRREDQERECGRQVTLRQGRVYTLKGSDSIDEAVGSARRVDPRVHRAARLPRAV